MVRIAREYPDLPIGSVDVGGLSSRDAAFAKALEHVILHRWNTLQAIADSQVDRDWSGQISFEEYLAMDEAKRNHSEAFRKLESKLIKLEGWMEEDKFQRETKVDPENHDQTARIRRIEVCLGKVMQALNIQDHVAEVAPISAPNSSRHLSPHFFASVVVHS